MIGLVRCMDLKEIKGLLNIIKDSGLNFVEIKTNELYIKTQNDVDKAKLCDIDKLIDSELGETDLCSIDEESNDIEFIRAPIVGVFKIRNDDEISTIVQVGEKVKKGQVLCYIEAMKMINEISSPYDAEVLEILVDHEQVVEYGQTLLKIRIL